MSEIASLLCNTQTNNSFICQRYIDNENKVSYFNCKPSKYDEYNFEKIVFLANNNSASASEALMGAVLDYDKQSGANIVNVIVEKSYSGTKEVYKTYGKGIMQQTYVNPLTGEAVKLTVAKIYWPISNICIQGSGLTPELDQRILAQNGNIIEQAMAL